MKKRAVCPKCEYIVERCLCATLRSIANKTKIIVLQHPSETGHALNTVNLMIKSFQNMDLIIGENFSEHQELNSIIKDFKESIALFFPTKKSIVVNSFSQKNITHLIFIDGTWKKAQKIYQLSTNLHDLNTYSLISTTPSQYKIRTSKLENALSTLEASLKVFESLEENLDTSSLNDSFLAMIEFQIEKMGEETFKKNYLNKKSDD